MISNLKTHIVLPCPSVLAACFVAASFCLTLHSAPFDAAPFGLPLPQGNGVMWEDPREIHQVVVHFKDTTPAPESVRLEYWGSRWPDQHLPKDLEPGGGNVGWMELGNWYTYRWRTADTEAKADGKVITFTFRPVNAKEFPNVHDYPAAFGYTLKLRVVSDATLPQIERIEAFTDSTLEPRIVNLAWKSASADKASFEVFNGAFEKLEQTSSHTARLRLRAVTNSDPNTLDRTLVTVRNGQSVFTFAVDDLKQGALFIPHAGVAVLPEGDAAIRRRGRCPKDCGRQDSLRPRSRNARADLAWRLGRHAAEKVPHLPAARSGQWKTAIRARRGRLSEVPLQRPFPARAARQGDPAPRAGASLRPLPFPAAAGARVPHHRRRVHADWPHHLGDKWRPHLSDRLCFRTQRHKADGPVPAADTPTVCLVKFVLTNLTASPQATTLPLTYQTGDTPKALRCDDKGLLWLGDNLRGQVLADKAPATEAETLSWTWTLAPGSSKTIIVKIPYLVLTEPSEHAALAALDFDKEHREIAGYWRRRLDESARLTTPEPMLNEFYRADAGHLLINCEGDPASAGRRFARVGSFSYGAFGNESCMMVVDLDRRGYHKEAQECLDAWLHYQGTVACPGDFSTKKGILYGAGGLEAGGYNQHHGWILWMLGEHYRFTRDDAWLRGAAPGIVAGADWIIRETKRTADRHELERGLLPAGSLEDIGDWWTWLRTSCYTWRGLDTAAWALEQIQHPEAQRVRKEADTYHTNLLANFRKATDRSPVVRLRDGTAVPQIPSMVHRRGVTSAGFAKRSKARCTCSSPARSTRAPRKPTGSSRTTRTTATSRINTATCWMTSTNTGSAGAASPCKPASCWMSSPTSTATT